MIIYAANVVCSLENIFHNLCFLFLAHILEDSMKPHWKFYQTYVLFLVL